MQKGMLKLNGAVIFELEQQRFGLPLSSPTTVQYCIQKTKMLYCTADNAAAAAAAASTVALQ